AIVMVPSCPRTLSDRPLVLNASSVLEGRLHPGTETPAFVACDGEEYGPLEPSQTLRLRTSGASVTLLHPRDHNYYELLRSQLSWGSASRLNRSAPRGRARPPRTARRVSDAEPDARDEFRREPRGPPRACA